MVLARLNLITVGVYLILAKDIIIIALMFFHLSVFYYILLYIIMLVIMDFVVHYTK